MQRLQDDYLAAYRSLKLTRDANGVLVVEFHSNGGSFTFTAQDLVKSMQVKSRPAAQKGKVA